jgi:hypothetical protein
VLGLGQLQDARHRRIPIRAYVKCSFASEQEDTFQEDLHPRFPTFAPFMQSDVLYKSNKLTLLHNQ